MKPIGLKSAKSVKRKRLSRSSFVRPGKDRTYGERSVKIAKSLLGKFVVRRMGRKRISGRIVEVEVYAGPKDRAAHSFGGKITPRNKVMYQRGGHAYVYLVYGMHWQMNLVTGQEGEPQCVLLRALEVSEGGRIASGPGKLCRYLRLDKSFHGEDITTSERLWLEDRGGKIDPKDIACAKRIGIDYAGHYWSSRRWRFYLKDSPAVSRG